ncbi:MAG: DUF6263 family protein [Chitinophagaceae bacterium]
MIKQFLFSFSLMALVATTGNAQKLALTKGQKVETIATSKMSMETMGQTIENEGVATTDIELKDITSDGFLFNNVIKHITTKITGAGQNISFDSDKKEDMDGPMGQALKDKIGTTQEIQVDKNGKVANIKDSGEKTGAGGMSDMMGMGGDLMKGQAYPILIQLPARKIKAGDSWVDSTGTVASIKTVTTYTLKTLTADGAQVSFTSVMSKSGTMQQNGMDLQIDMSGTTKGESTYEANTGILKSSTGTTDIQGTVGVMGQNMPINGTVTVNMVVKKS